MANVFDQFDTPAPAAAAPATAAPPATGNVFDQFDPPARTPARQPRSRANPFDSVAEAPSFDERFDAAAPMSRAGAAPQVAGDGPRSVGSDQAAADALYAGMRRTADRELIGEPSAGNSAIAGLIGAGQGASLNLAGRAGAAVATGLGWLEGKNFPGVSGYGGGERTFEENYDRFHDLRDAHARQSPKSTLAGTVAGALAAAPMMPGLPVAQGAGLATRAGAYGVTGGAYGTAGELIDSADAGRALAAGAGGLVAGAALGPAIEKLAPPVVTAAGKALAPILERFGIAGARTPQGAFTSEARAALQAAGLDADTLPPELADSLHATFAAKGPSVAAAREAQAAEFGIPLSRGQATADPRALALEGQALAGRSGPRAQEIGDAFGARQAEAVAGARDRFLGMAAGDAPRVGAPQEAFEAVADRARQMAQAGAEREAVAQRGVDDALRAVRGRGGTDALDGAEAAISGLRDAAEQSRGAYRAAYGEVGQFPGTFMPGAMDRVGSRVRDRLGADVPLDDVLTPAASRAIRDLDDVPGLFNLQPGEGPSLQQVEQLRKRLVAYRGSTGQNATDRRAVDRILGELDSHVEDAMGAGLFGQRPAAVARPAADDFPGLPSAGPAPLPASGGRPDPKAESLVQYLARNGGVALDGDARAADLGRIMTPFGPLGRKGGRPIEDFRDQLASEGFIRPDSPDGMISRRIGDEVHDLIGIERGGDPVYRLADISRGGAPRDVGGRIADQSAAASERMGAFRQQVVDDLASVGVDARHIDPAHLDDAAGRLFRREAETGADAYEAAVLSRVGDDAGRAAVSAPDVPFDGATARATSDALPGGDTAPLAAMQRARGLFREHQQAFKPRGPGDVAGQRLQRIVERDASPNEVAAMLFGSPGTGRVAGGQMQTLSRLREAVGPDSEAWRATQQALVARHLGGEGRDLLDRVRYLVRGEGRGLMYFLSPEQRGGLGQLEVALRQAESARQPAPDWIASLERTGFDPNAVGRSLFGGSGAIGAKPGAVHEARAAKGLLGEDSAEWAGLRQAAVHRLLDPATPAARMVAQIRDFTDGSGKGVAGTLFAPEEMSHFRRLAGALQSTVRPDGAAKAGAAGETGRKAVAKALDLIAGAVAFKVGGLPAAAGTYGAKVGQRALLGGVGAAQARRSFEGGAPRLAPPPAPYAVQAGSEGARVGGLLGAMLVPSRER